MLKLLALLLSCLFFVSEAKCSLRLTLLDSYGDGFNGNTLTLTTNGKALALTPVSGLATVNSDGSATLSGGSVGAFQFYTEAGDGVSFDYEYSVYAAENSWRVELFDAYAPFGPVVLASSTFSASNIPTCVDIGTVICGPLPAAVSNVVTTPGVYAQEVKFDWPSVAVSDSDNSVVYTVSYRDIADSNPNNWILLAQPSSVSEISAIFPPAKTFQVQIVAVNQYGASQPFLLTYTTPAYATNSVFVKLFDSAQNGWGAYDGFVFVVLGNFAAGSLTFPCATGSICTEILYEVKIPVGVAYAAHFVYQAPSSGGADCSWAIYNSAATTSNALFQSGQNAQGPIIKNFDLNCNYPGTPTKSGGSTGTTPTPAACPSSEPQAGTACTGQTPSGGCAYEASCCCPNEAIASNKACVSNVYTCNGQGNATWQVVVPTPVCTSDPTFTCPSDCPATAPTSKVGTSCSAAITCNYPVTCGGSTGCTRTDTYACTGASTLSWQQSQSCTCSNITTCAAWENLITSGDCCVTPPHCETDSSSTVCLTPTDWTPCAATSGTCGAGTQSRTTYTRQSNKQCLSSSVKQSCTIPCPVACVGSWSNYTACSVSCGQGVKTRKFTVTTAASNGGTPCQTADGTIDTAQCDTTSACAAPTQCYYVVDAFDAYGDGWDTAYVKISYNGSAANLTINVPFVSGSTSSKTAQKTFSVVKGNTITFQYFIQNEGYPQEASFAVAAGIASSTGAITRVGNDLLQNPTGLAVDTPPTTTVTLKANCATCSGATPAFCASLNRVTCENAQVGDDTCGMCLSGYTSATLNSGRTACTDIDECAASTNPCGSSGVICTNTPGAFNCSCAAGYTPFNGGCLQGTCPTYRLRKEWTDLSDAEKDRFVRAVVALGKTFWTRTKNAHATAATDPNNVHTDSWFLPWHRGFLDEVESEFFVLPGDLRCTCLPYWDWTRASEQGANAQSYLQSKLFTDAKSGTLSVGLGLKSAATWVTDATHPFKTLDGYRAAYSGASWSGYGTATIYGGALTQTTYAGLTNFLVNGAHGSLHVWVGGMMGYLNLAAGDPIFFLHHGFLEVLHSAWQSCKGYTNRDNVPAAAWSSSPHPIGQKMPVGLTKSRSWYDLYSNDILKIKFGTSFLSRVSATSSSYCPAGASSGLFALVEQAAKGKSSSSYVIGTPVVHNATGATYHSVPTEDAADSGLSTNKKKGKKGRRKVSYNVTKTVKTHTDKQNTPDNQAAVDIYTEAAETFKKVYKATGDLQQAYSASVDVECSTKNYTSELTTSLSMIKEMKMERMCAQGLCFHQCYLRQKGRNKDAFKSDYQNKVDAGQEQSYKNWKKSQKKTTAKGTAPTKRNTKPKSAKKSYVEFIDDAPMAQF